MPIQRALHHNTVRYFTKLAAPEEYCKSAGAIGAVTFAFLTSLYKTNPSWMYTQIGGTDAYFFVGYGLYFNIPDFRNEYYKVSRLPWDIFQFFARTMFQPIPAEIAIHFSLFIASSVLLYLICSRLLSKTAGVAAAFFAAALTLLHANGGADYHNAACGPLFFAVVASIVWMVKKPDKLRYAVCGIFLALLLHTFIVYLYMLPYLVGLGIMLALFNGRQIRELLVICLWVAVGAIITTAALAGINATFGRGWLFFMPQIRFVLNFARHPEWDSWWRPWSLTWASGAYLGIIFGMSCIAVLESIRIFISRNLSPERNSLTVHILFIVQVLIWTTWQTFGHHTFLQPSYFAYPLYGPLLISLAAFLSPRLDSRPATFWLVLLLMPICFYVSLRFNIWFFDPLRQLLQWPVIVAALAMAMVYFGMLVARRGKLAAIAVVLLLPAINGATALTPYDYVPTSCPITLQNYDFMVRNSVILARTVPQPGQIYVWFDEHEPLRLPPDCPQGARIADIGNAFIGVGPSYIDAPFPMKAIEELSSERLKIIGKSDAVFVAITYDETKADALARRFESAGVHVRFDGRLLPQPGVSLPPFYILRTVGQGLTRLCPNASHDPSAYSC